MSERYENEHTQFVAVFPNLRDKPDLIAAYKEKFDIPFRTKTDYFKTLTEKFGATVTPEVVVYNETKEEKIYQGRIDNTYYKLGRKRGVTTSKELEMVLEALKNGEEITVKSAPAIGCFLQ